VIFQQSHYRVGDPIFVRVGFVNNSSHSIDILAAVPPWVQVDLTITGADGKRAPQGLSDLSGYSGSGRTFSLEPGTVRYLSWKGETFIPLDHWSYRLTTPGTYKVVARAQAEGPYIVDSRMEQSTTTTLTIDP